MWPEIEQGIKDSGILNMDIFRVANRLVMTINAEDDFSFEEKKAQDEANQKVQEWERLMSNFQQKLTWAKEDEKWVLMKRIYKLG